jgi:hypothetical protein
MVLNDPQSVVGTIVEKKHDAEATCDNPGLVLERGQTMSDTVTLVTDGNRNDSV